MGENDVITFARLLLIKSYPNLQVMRTCINAWMIILGNNDLLWLNVPVNDFSVMPGWSHRFLGITSTFRGVNVSLLKETTRRW